MLLLVAATDCFVCSTSNWSCDCTHQFKPDWICAAYFWQKIICSHKFCVTEKELLLWPPVIQQLVTYMLYVLGLMLPNEYHWFLGCCTCVLTFNNYLSRMTCFIQSRILLCNAYSSFMKLNKLYKAHVYFFCHQVLQIQLFVITMEDHSLRWVEKLQLSTWESYMLNWQGETNLNSLCSTSLACENSIVLQYEHLRLSKVVSIFQFCLYNHKQSVAYIR